MATVTFIYTEDPEEVGYEAEMTYTREGVDDIFAMNQFLTQALIAAGYTWVTDVGVVNAEGDEKWGGF